MRSNFHGPPPLAETDGAVRGTVGALGARSHRWRRLLVAPPVIGVAVLAAACGGVSPGAGVASLGSTTTTTQANGPGSGTSSNEHASFAKYARCMRSHGVSKFPDPTASTGSIKVTKRSLVSTPNFSAASQTCEKYAPAGTAPVTLTSKDRTDYLKAAACMRSHGIAGFPDPVFSGSTRVSFPIPNTMSTNSPQFLRARETCEKLIPPGLPYSKQAEGGQ